MNKKRRLLIKDVFFMYESNIKPNTWDTADLEINCYTQ